MLAAVASGAAPSHGVETKIWRLESSADLSEGSGEGVAVAGEGGLLLSPSSQMLLEVPEAAVSAVAVGGDGTIWVGTANEGALWSLRRGGEGERALKDLGLQVSAIAVGPEGRLYVAWNPYGKVLRIETAGGELDVTELLEMEETYLWDLAFSSDGRLLAVTGDPARLLEIDPDSGKSHEIFTLPETNFTCLRVEADGRVVLGTDGQGLVMEAPAGSGGKPRVLWDSDLRQISALARDSEGVLWAAAVAEPLSPGDEDESSDEPEEIPFAVARIIAGQPAEIVWKGSKDPVFSLAPRAEGGVLAGTGGEGRLWALDGTAEPTLLIDTPQEQITALVGSPGGMLVATANLGRLLRLGTARGREGAWRSPVLDARSLSRWGRLRYEATAPAGARVRFETRSGATERPDATWSPWQKLRDGAVTSPPARRLQWRARLEASGAGTGPEVRWVEVAWQQVNLAPRITELTVHEPGLVYDKKLATASLEGEGPARFSTKVDPDENRKPFHIPGWRTISWDASDPNEDRLSYRLEISPADSDESWLILAESQEEEAWSWDARNLPDGWWHVRVTASDAPSNPLDDRRETSRVSDPFLIDTTGPVIDRVRLRDRRLEFRARDAADAVAAASISTAGGPWMPLLPVDGIADEAEERYEAALPGIEPGDLIVIRAEDRTGNLTTATP